jgi:hypothetical protein
MTDRPERKGGSMYVKILTRKTETNPGRSISILGVDEVEFFENELNFKTYKEFCQGATRNSMSEEQFEGLRLIGCLSITRTNGKNEFILFDRVAFLCNEQGKAVERYSVS